MTDSFFLYSDPVLIMFSNPHCEMDCKGCRAIVLEIHVRRERTCQEEPNNRYSILRETTLQSVHLPSA